MKNLYTLFISCICAIGVFTSCNHSQEFILKGTLGTKKGENFLIVYDDPIAKIDTISPIEGEFEYSFIPDTTTLLRLVNKEGKVIPIFADKGWEVNCKGTFDTPDIDGDAHNHDYHDFLKSIKDVENQDSITVIAEQFIRKHPHSFASAYLIDHYFIQAEEPSIEKVVQLITPLNGEVKDSRVLNVAMKSVPADKAERRSLSYFSLTDRNGKYLSWNIKNNQFILVNFWASWDKKSITACKSLRSFIEKSLKGKVKVFNISLDYNKEEWLKSCQADSESWVEICNFKGWEAPIVKQNNILSLPSNILIDSQRTILAKDISNIELTNKTNKES